MSATTPAVRRDGVPPWELEPGEYTLTLDDSGAITRVWVRLPNGQGPADVTGWAPVVDAEGRLTLSPSILSHPDSAAVNDAGDMQQIGTGWHGFLEHDVWREC